MFESERFSGLPGAVLAAELAAADPFGLDEDDLAAYLRAVDRLEAWAGSCKGRGLCAFAARHTVPEPPAGMTAGHDGTPLPPPRLSTPLRPRTGGGWRGRCASVGWARRWSTSSPRTRWLRCCGWRR